MHNKRTADSLLMGEINFIAEIECSEISNKLMEMNCIPGESICLKYTTPYGGPKVFEVGGILIGMRINEAKSILIQSK